MNSAKPLVPIERYLIGIVFGVPIACAVVAATLFFPQQDALELFTGVTGLLCIANPVLFGLGGYTANRISRQPAKSANVIKVTAIGYLIAAWPWTVFVALAGGAVGPCGGTGFASSLVFVWLILPSLGAAAALYGMTRSVLVGLSAIIAALAGTGVAAVVSSTVGDDASIFFVAEAWIAIVLTAMFAWAFRERKKPRASDGMCEGCGYDLSGNESGVCPECGAAAVGGMRG